MIIWPEYFLASLTRKEGRKVGKDLAINNLLPEKLLNACKRLGYICSVEGGKRYPRLGVKALNYRLIVELPRKKGLSKNQLIKELAKLLQQNTA